MEEVKTLSRLQTLWKGKEVTRLDELHRAYMRDLENDNETRQINEYRNTGDDIVELDTWHPVAKPEKTNILQRITRER